MKATADSVFTDFLYAFNMFFFQEYLSKRK